MLQVYCNSNKYSITYSISMCQNGARLIESIIISVHFKSGILSPGEKKVIVKMSPDCVYM